MSLRQRARCLTLSAALCLIGGAAISCRPRPECRCQQHQAGGELQDGAGRASAYPYYDARVEIERYAVVAYESYQAASAAAHDFRTP
jgi:hypothetical protein